MKTHSDVSEVCKLQHDSVKSSLTMVVLEKYVFSSYYAI